MLIIKSFRSRVSTLHVRHPVACMSIQTFAVDHDAQPIRLEMKKWRAQGSAQFESDSIARGTIAVFRATMTIDMDSTIENRRHRKLAFESPSRMTVLSCSHDRTYRCGPTVVRAVLCSYPHLFRLK